MSSLSPLLYFRPKDWPKHIHDLATIAPLVSGVIAPLAVLYDIPALSEKWYTKDGVSQPDFKASLVLSAISLVATVIANALLVIRFSLVARRWRIATRISVIFWGIKVGVSLANIIMFGALRREGNGYRYAEGFWCAVLSVILAGIVFFLLLLHWAIELRTRGDVKTNLQQTVRVTGRHFMLQTTLFVATVAIMAVIFCFIEGWTYLQSLYFAIVTLLTVGFGDFEPTSVSTRIVLFPLALIGIAQLGSILSLIVSFFSSRAAQRKAQSRALLERQRQIEQDKVQHNPDLFVEIDFLVKLNSGQDMKDQMSEVAFSVAGFLLFWLVGAAIFMATESWTYPTSLYFCYIFFLSIGYGDFSPITPAGRVVFIIYALLAVPIMATFAVTAIQGIVTQFSEWRLAKRKVHEGIENAGAEDSRDVIPHAEYVERHHRRLASPKSSRHSNSQQEFEERKEEQDRRQRDLDKQEEEQKLTLALIEHALSLEMHARRLLETHLPNGSKAQIVLKADRNVQLRHLQLMQRRAEEVAAKKKRDVSSGTGSTAIAEDDEHDDDDQSRSQSHKDRGRQQRISKQKAEEDRMARLQMEQIENQDDDPDWISHPLDDAGTMEEIRRYREAFAAFLATGSRLRRLEGAEKFKAERRLMEADDEVEVEEVNPSEKKRSGSDQDAGTGQEKSDSRTRKVRDEGPHAKGNRAPNEELGQQNQDHDDTL